MIHKPEQLLDLTGYIYFLYVVNKLQLQIQQNNSLHFATGQFKFKA
jgi:hypothetical protein